MPEWSQWGVVGSARVEISAGFAVEHSLVAAERQLASADVPGCR